MASGKKVALYGCLGCGGFILLILMVLIAGIGFISYRGYQFGKDIGEAYTGIFDKYNENNLKYPFTPPEDGILNDERTALVFAIRTSTSEFARQKRDAMDQTGDAIGSNMESPGILSKIEGVKKIAAIVHQAARLGADIAEENIRLLDEHKMSMNEYRWTVKTCLGTLYQAAQSQVDDATSVWNEYLDKFDKGSERLGNMNIDTGHDRFRSRDINRSEFIERLQDVPFVEQNYAIVKNYLSQLYPDQDTGILDFLAIKMNEMLREDSQEHNVHH